MPQDEDLSRDVAQADGAQSTEVEAAEAQDLEGGEGIDESFFLDDQFDPLAVDDSEIDQEDMDDDNPWDTVDYPTMREMPKHMTREAVFTPEKCGSAREALESLLDHNPGRKGVLLMILDACRQGCLSSEVTDKVLAFQKDDFSVYEPMTLCRMLERARVLELTMPEVTEEHADDQDGVDYLVIKEKVDPVWTSTAEGLAVYEEEMSGKEFRSIVLERDKAYIEVYHAVMELIGSAPRKPAEIEAVVDTFDVVKNPRRFGGHFIDMLERTGAIVWSDRSWQLTELGRNMLAELRTERA